MSRPPDENPDQNPVRASDAWDEFLSEGSSELQRLKSELHGQTAPSPLAPPADCAPVEGLWKSPPESDVDSPSSFDRFAPVSPVEEAAPRVVDEPASRSAREPEGRPERLALPSATGDPAPPPEVPVSGPPAPAPAATPPVPGTTPAPSRSAPRPPRGTAHGVSDGLSLAHLLAQRVPVKWPEAVATIEELCAVLVHQAPSAPVPTLQHIIITPAGEVHVLPGSRGPRDTATVGRLLHSLLAHTATPLPLRLFVTSSIASSRYESIELYAEALADYALPNRTELIAALCRRALETPAAAQGAVSAKPRSARGTDGSARPARGPRRRWWLWIAVGMCVSLAGSSGLWFLYASSWSAPSVSRVATATTVAAAADGSSPDLAGGSADVSPVAPVEWSPPLSRDPWALGAIGPFTAERVASRVSADASARGPNVRAPLVLDAAAAPALGLPAVARLERSETGSVQSAAVAPVLRGETTARALVPPLPVTANRPDPSPPGSQESVRIYTSADTDVQPPVLAAGQPKPLPPALADSPARVSVELLIDERGVVQSATVVGRPQRWDEMMMLSSLKNLRFHPATKDGAVVPYRLRVQP